MFITKHYFQLRNRKNRSEPSCSCRAGCVQAAPEEQNCCSLRPWWVWQCWRELQEQEELQLGSELWAMSCWWGQEGQTSCLFVLSSLYSGYSMTHVNISNMQDILSAVHAQCICIKTWNAYENFYLAVPCCSPLMDTCLLFPVDLLSVIWCPQYLSAICDLKESAHAPGPEMQVFTPLCCYQHLMAVFSIWHTPEMCPLGLLPLCWALREWCCELCASCKSKCLPCSLALKTPVFALVKGGVDGGVMSGPELNGSSI